jgi:hypothetical protein
MRWRREKYSYEYMYVKGGVYCASLLVYLSVNPTLQIMGKIFLMGERSW